VEPSCELTLNNLGFALAKNGEWSEAIRSYLKAIEKDPGYTIVYDNLRKIPWSEVSQFVLQETIIGLGKMPTQTVDTKNTLYALNIELQRKN
jgi:tetratricopeptide (TPR) repeat protein